jgi:hypothetical protein
MFRMWLCGMLACGVGLSGGCQTNTERGAITGRGPSGEPPFNTAAAPSRISGQGLSAVVGTMPLVGEREPVYGRAQLAGAEPVTKSSVISWTQRGLSDDVIIDRIERSGAVFNLTAADVNELRDKGVSPSVIQIMRR